MALNFGKIEIFRTGHSLLDLNMPVMNGLEVIPLIKTEYPRLRIVIVTKYNDTKFVRECLQIHNVAGYILKTSALSELLDGLAQVAKGQLFMSKSIQLYPKDVVEDVEVNLFEESFLAKYNLTRRELEILSLVAQAKVMRKLLMDSSSAHKP